MSFNILETFDSVLGGPLVRQLSSSLGEPEQNTRSALQATGPTILATLMQQVAKPGGAAEVLRTMNDDRIDDGIGSKLSSILGNRSSIDALATTGESVGRTFFGSSGGAVVNALSAVSGIKSGSALKLISLGLPIILGIVRKYMTRSGGGSTGLTSLLLEQRGSLANAGLDNRITGALGFSNLSTLLDSLPRDVASVRPANPVARESRQGKRWLPWAAAAGAAALALLVWTGQRANRPEVATATTRSVDRGIASAAASVYFDRGEVALGSDDRRKIMRVAAAVKSESRPVAVTGYTDRTGNLEQNMEVAKDRAGAVREALVAEGVDENRIVMDEPTLVTGSGNDSEARRVDIVVR